MQNLCQQCSEKKSSKHFMRISRPAKAQKSNPIRLSKILGTPASDSSLLTDIFWILTKGSEMPA